MLLLRMAWASKWACSSVLKCSYLVLYQAAVMAVRESFTFTFLTYAFILTLVHSGFTVCAPLESNFDLGVASAVLLQQTQNEISASKCCFFKMKRFRIMKQFCPAPAHKHPACEDIQMYRFISSQSMSSQVFYPCLLGIVCLAIHAFTQTWA